jgi:iron complex outermembrane receptor protein
MQSTGRSGIIATHIPGCNHGRKRGARFGPARIKKADMPRRLADLASLALCVLAFVSTTPVRSEPGQDEAAASPSVVVTATRSERNSFDLPVSIDRIDAGTIRDGRPMVNLSESLPQVPGVVVQNRQNYAQDLQISSRGFGARTQFGVRGVRLYTDGIPATSPDGQGQTSNFDLASAERIEIMRGPFSALYGNAAGGVIQLFTESGPPVPTLTLDGAAGSYRTKRYGAKLGGRSGTLDYLASASRFSTDGYRDHSEAKKNLGNAKLKFAMSEDTHFTFILNAVRLPAQDPAGLSRAQFEQDPRQVDPSVIQFDTRKEVAQNQLGGVAEHRLSASDSLRLAVYSGNRTVTQYLAIPLAAQNAATSSGGVVDLDRSYYGLDLRWLRTGETSGRPFALAIGSEYDNQDERRKGYINNNGVAGALKRDEDDTVHSAAVYAQGDWKFAQDWNLSAGLRYTEVSFRSTDYFTTLNPDDSGRISFRSTSPAAGLVYSIAPSLNLYGNVGRGFETPTFAELAYRSDGTSGLNFALQPSTSVNTELGAKAFLPGDQRLTFALFHVDTKNEIVVDTASGGRTTFKNASRTERKGAELSWSAGRGEPLTLLAALSVVDARYRDDFASGTPPVTVSAGNYLPGVPRRTAYGEARWAAQRIGLSSAVELRYGDRIYTSDTNAEWADSYTVVNWRIVLEQRARTWRVSEFLRIDNLFDKNYIGSVIVGDSNRRYYEPAPRRNFTAGVSGMFSF